MDEAATTQVVTPEPERYDDIVYDPEIQGVRR
jgi:hypothetical protein